MNKNKRRTILQLILIFKIISQSNKDVVPNKIIPDHVVLVKNKKEDSNMMIKEIETKEKDHLNKDVIEITEIQEIVKDNVKKITINILVEIMEEEIITIVEEIDEYPLFNVILS